MSKDLNDVWVESGEIGYEDSGEKLVEAPMRVWPAPPSYEALERAASEIATLAEDDALNENKDAALEVVRALARNESAINAIGGAYVESPGDGVALFSDLRSWSNYRGLSTLVSEVEKVVKKKAKEYSKFVKTHERQQRIARRQGLEKEIAKSAGEVDLGLDDDAQFYNPFGWAISEDGIQRIKISADGEETREIVTRRPILITKIFRDVETDGRVHLIKWERRGNWDEAIVKKSNLQDKRSFIKALADNGAPVGDDNAKHLMKFLHDFEETNIGNIPEGLKTDRMGWLGGEGQHGFMMGAELIGGDSEVYPNFEEGYSDIAKAFRKKGSFEKWKEVVETHLLDHPLVMISLYAACSAPLLQVLESAPNMIIDWSSETSLGKTTVLRCGASVWGYPEKDSRGLIRSWNATTTGIERFSHFHNHLPVFLDDTKEAKNKDELHQFVYSFSSGIGKGRGTLENIQRQLSWRSILMSTGESPITSYGKAHGGQSVRVLEIEDPPFGDGAQESLVKQITIDLLSNYGHAGERVIQWMSRNRSKWSGLEQRYKDLIDAWNTRLSGNLGSRLSDQVALLEMGFQLVHNVLGIKKPANDPIEALAQIYDKKLGEIKHSDNALRALYDWCVSHPSRFYGTHSSNDKYEGADPVQGWVGAWEPKDQIWEGVYFIKTELQEILERLGYHHGDVMKSWISAGYVMLESDGRARKRKKIGYQPTVPTFAIRRDAFSQVGSI